MRNINIHLEPVEPLKIMQIKIAEIVELPESALAVIKSPSGKKVIKSIPTESKREKKKSKPSVESRIIYKFNDWPGEEDVITLCARCLLELEDFMNEGIKKGFITG